MSLEELITLANVVMGWDQIGPEDDFAEDTFCVQHGQIQIPEEDDLSHWRYWRPFHCLDDAWMLIEQGNVSPSHVHPVKNADDMCILICKAALCKAKAKRSIN